MYSKPARLRYGLICSGSRVIKSRQLSPSKVCASPCIARRSFQVAGHDVVSSLFVKPRPALVVVVVGLDLLLDRLLVSAPPISNSCVALPPAGGSTTDLLSPPSSIDPRYAHTLGSDYWHLKHPPFNLVQLMKDRDSGEGKGYAFVAFKTKEVAQNAIEEIHNKKYKSRVLVLGLKLLSSLRCSLQLIYADNIYLHVLDVVGAKNLIKRRRTKTNVKNCRRENKIIFTPRKLFFANSQVKALYVKNILENTTTKQFKELFSRHGEVTKVVMPPSKAGGKRDFGFIHYAERSSALKAVKDSEKYEIDGQLLEVVLVKPQAEKKPNMGYDYNPGLAHLEFGGAFAGNLHGSVIGVAGAGYGVAPSWMVLMALPNGKIGYVL
ncbi:polyadenylate-binding protein, cytoplasmic and nuclear-like [Arachis ipaensis]|uniref:polyadenylate-binding protein, cytoplasmic and nuclear-like n=1 Tax=Arachis ipaensis TaxID=130454 RepID=UPI000A2AFB2C|nr:polyadenylate-binding protein, cytoplasmic and nuclear-like [Arachis ipaensis]